jgi:hypothetical protein
MFPLCIGAGMGGSDDLSAIRAQGFTHLEGWCAACRVVKVMPLETLEGLAPGLGLRAIAPRLTCRACRGPVTEVKPCHHGPGSFSAKPWDGPPFA